MYKNLTTICAAAALALGLAACGGGGGGSNNQANVTPPPPPTPPMEYDVALPAGHGLANGMTTIDAGDTVTLPGGTQITCPGPADCALTVSTDGVTGVQSASSTGGMVAVTTEATRMAAEQAAAAEELRLAEGAVDEAEAALTAAQEAYADGTGTGNAVTAAEETLAMAVEHRDSLLPPPPEPVVVAASGSVMLDALQDAFIEVLPEPGDSDSFVIPAGGTAVRQGVTFACNSERACTVTLTNSLDTIVATWMSYDVDDAEAMVVASVPAPPPVPVDTFANLNPGSAATIAGIAAVLIDAAAADPDGTPNSGDETPRGAYGNVNHAIGGMGLGDSGATDLSGFTLTGAMDPNGPNFVAAAPAAVPPTPAVGSAMALGMTNDEIAASADMATIPNWDLRALFRDWGDTAGMGDGGFETGALIAFDFDAPTMQPFDATLAPRFANANAQATFNFTVLATGVAAVAPAVNTSVAINAAGVPIGTLQGANMVFDSTSLVGAQSQDIAIDPGETFAGSYFGARGQYRCTAANAGTSCGLMRNADGTVGLIDQDGATAGIQNGTWSFTPAAGAMIAVPDQDWMVYGAWLTTPDNAAVGQHRLGAFFSGMDTYAGATQFADATAIAGSATYTGGAVGTYRDGTAAGLFTATASLTANFDVNGNNTDDAATDYMLSGRIDDFRGADGQFLGQDTAANPNDPVSGGENDWVVSLGTVDLAATAGGVLPLTPTTGSADGVQWTGNWSGQLYGPDTVGGTAVAPSGVGGQFRASNANTAVVGAFGARAD